MGADQTAGEGLGGGGGGPGLQEGAVGGLRGLQRLPRSGCPPLRPRPYCFPPSAPLARTRRTASTT
ncbi:hypothetical protein KGD82_19715 [Nocardiopsis eucommiae]|uniref:Uncharacterized protein n=1 Tax=Nocardiopsis eucommiae TaxID=2831970 RepID=A0A975LCM9_9ACTN|nr:hypothetical protein KGD82_19715 [Nocardiopsis eucommiae]